MYFSSKSASKDPVENSKKPQKTSDKSSVTVSAAFSNLGNRNLSQNRLYWLSFILWNCMLAFGSLQWFVLPRHCTLCRHLKKTYSWFIGSSSKMISHTVVRPTCQFFSTVCDKCLDIIWWDFFFPWRIFSASSYFITVCETERTNISVFSVSVSASHSRLTPSNIPRTPVKDACFFVFQMEVSSKALLEARHREVKPTWCGVEGREAVYLQHQVMIILLWRKR